MLNNLTLIGSRIYIQTGSLISINLLIRLNTIETKDWNADKTLSVIVSSL